MPSYNQLDAPDTPLHQALQGNAPDGTALQECVNALERLRTELEQRQADIVQDAAREASESENDDFSITEMTETVSALAYKLLDFRLELESPTRVSNYRIRGGKPVDLSMPFGLFAPPTAETLDSTLLCKKEYTHSTSPKGLSL